MQELRVKKANPALLPRSGLSVGDVQENRFTFEVAGDRDVRAQEAVITRQPYLFRA